MPEPPASPSLIGLELRSLRESTGRTAADVAAALNLAPSTLSRLETSSQAPRRSTVTALLDELGVHGRRRDQVLALLKQTRRQGWWTPYRTSLSTAFFAYIGHEDAADLIHVFEPDTIPGLLQVEDYTRALTSARHPGLDGEAIDQVVAVRAARQKRLDGPAPVRLWVVLGEAALRYQVGGRAVMRAQLEHLLAMARTRHVTVSIARFANGAPLAKGPFTVLTFPEDLPDVTYLETVGDDQWVVDGEDVRVFRDLWERLLAAGTKYDETIATIEEAISALA